MITKCKHMYVYSNGQSRDPYEEIYKPSESPVMGGLVDPEYYEFEEPWLNFRRETFVITDDRDNILCQCDTRDQADNLQIILKRA